MKFYNIPFNYDFLESVYYFLKEEFGKKNKFSDLTIFLPSRRSVNELKRIFIKYNEVTFLPTIKAIGDISYDDVILSSFDNNIENIIKLIKPISNIKYKLLLINEFLKFDQKYNIQQAIVMADEFNNFLQEIEQNNCDITTKLDELIEDEYKYSEHWKKILYFLKEFNSQWKIFLEKNNIVGEDSYKNQIINYYINNYKNLNTLKKPVLIVGNFFTTDNMIELVKNLIKFDNSYLIFKGFDNRNIIKDIIKEREKYYDDNNEFNFNFSFLFSNLVRKANIDIDQIKDLKFKNHINIGDKETEIILASSIPNKICYKWKNDVNKYNNADFSSINYYECRNIYQEIEYIKYYILDYIENKGAKNIAIVTTEQYSQELEIALKSCINSEKFKVNNSFGYNFVKTKFAQTLFNTINIVNDEFEKNNFEIEDVIKISYLFNDKLLEFDEDDKDAINKFLNNKSSYINIIVNMDENKNKFSTDKTILTEKYLSIEDINKVKKIIKWLKNKFNYFLKEGNKNLSDMIEEHLKLIDGLFLRKIRDSNINEDEKKQQKEILEIIDYLRLIQKEAGNFKIKNNFEYKNILEYFLSQKSYNENFSSYPAVNIIDRKEARLINYDLVVIFNCIEDNFPKNIEIDPWLNNHFRVKLGLHTKSVAIGKDYYDFLQLITQKQVLITRTLKDPKTSSITFQSRFLRRFVTYLKTIKISNDFNKDFNRNFLEKTINKKQIFPKKTIERKQISRPNFHFDFNNFLKNIKISATNFDTLIKNPYDFYCHKYLKLKDESFINMDNIDTIKGSLIHKIFEIYSKNLHIYKNDQNKLTDLIIRIMKQYFLNDKTLLLLYKKEIKSMVKSFLKQDIQRCNEDNFYKSIFEYDKEYKYNGIMFTAIVDRIDIFSSNNIKIVDYKSSTSYNKNQIQNGLKLQLPVEAFILKNNNFNILSVEYWKKDKNEIKVESVSKYEKSKNIDYILTQIKNIIDNTFNNLINSSEIVATNHNEYSKYKHISRVEEWLYS